MTNSHRIGNQTISLVTRVHADKDAEIARLEACIVNTLAWADDAEAEGDVAEVKRLDDAVALYQYKLAIVRDAA